MTRKHILFSYPPPYIVSQQQQQQAAHYEMNPPTNFQAFDYPLILPQSYVRFKTQ